MSFLCRNLVVFHVAFVCAFFAWLFGGTRGDLLIPTMPWVFALLLEGMICFPQRKDYETTYDARLRVWHSFSRDPLSWVSIIFILLLTIPFFNTGLCEVCDYPAIVDGADPSPTLPFAPFCVRRMDHLNVCLWFVPSLLAMLATRHALTKSGKRLLLRILVWNGTILAVLGAVQQMMGAPGPLWQIQPNSAFGSDQFYSTFGYPNMAGDFFTTLFGLAAGLWRWDWAVYAADQKYNEIKGGAFQVRRSWFWRKHGMLIPAGILYLSAINTLSRAAMLLVSSLAILFYLHTFFGHFVKFSKLKMFKSMFFSVIVLGFFVGAAFYVTPRSVQRELDSLSAKGVLDRVSGVQHYHSRIAMEIIRDYPFFGCGGWGYKHFCLPRMKESDFRAQQTAGGINVHNDCLQFIVEHGIIGFGLLVTVVLILLRQVFRIWKEMYHGVRFLPRRKQPATPVSFFVLPAPVFFIFLTAVATVIHSFGDCPLRSPAILSLFFVSLAAMEGFLPALKEDVDDIPEN